MIKLLALDFDGTMTDGKVYVDQYGNETVCCSRRDGLGIGMLKESGMEIVVISTETNPVVEKRCAKLKIACNPGIKTAKDKLKILKKIVSERKLAPAEIAYMGDDVNDLEFLKFAGLAITVADGHKECKKLAEIVTQNKGGNHAVREICDLLLKKRQAG